MAGINLQKGQRAAIADVLFTVGLGWDVTTAVSGDDFDLDASLFMVGADGQISVPERLVFYNNKKSLCGSVEHSGDNKTGAGDGDDETIRIDTSKIPADVEALIVVVTIHEAASRKQNFGQVRNAYIRLVNQAGEATMNFDLGEDFSTETAVEFGKIYKKDGAWKFEAVGTGIAGGLEAYVAKHAALLA